MVLRLAQPDLTAALTGGLASGLGEFFLSLTARHVEGWVRLLCQW